MFKYSAQYKHEKLFTPTNYSTRAYTPMNEDITSPSSTKMKIFRRKIRSDMVASYKHFEVFIDIKQFYPGRMFVLAKRCDAKSFTDLHPDEHLELGLIARDLEYAYAQIDVLRPDVVNYAFLGNDLQHFHMHVIPRYKSPRTILDETFTDIRWGHSYSCPEASSYQTPKSILCFMRQALKRAISDTGLNKTAWDIEKSIKYADSEIITSTPKPACERRPKLSGKCISIVELEESDHNITAELITLEMNILKTKLQLLQMKLQLQLQLLQMKLQLQLQLQQLYYKLKCTSTRPLKAAPIEAKARINLQLANLRRTYHLEQPPIRHNHMVLQYSLQQRALNSIKNNIHISPLIKTVPARRGNGNLHP